MPHSRISCDPTVMLGKPCIKGIRISVELVLKWLAAGRTSDELLEAYPQLVVEDIEAALSYAAEAVNRLSPEAAE